MSYHDTVETKDRVMTIAPVDNSLYLGLINGIETFPAKGSLNAAVPAAYTQERDFNTSADLSGYYSDPETTDLYTEVSNNVIKSAEVLENVMSQALENGFGVQDAVNMTRAMRAYQANCAVAKSTFEFKL